MHIEESMLWSLQTDLFTFAPSLECIRVLVLIHLISNAHYFLQWNETVCILEFCKAVKHKCIRKHTRASKYYVPTDDNDYNDDVHSSNH